MLLATPALSTLNPLSVMAPEPYMPPRQVLSEADLASRWGMSPKTLQRWRMEGRGPHYLKLGKRVTTQRRLRPPSGMDHESEAPSSRMSASVSECSQPSCLSQTSAISLRSPLSFRPTGVQRLQPASPYPCMSSNGKFQSFPNDRYTVLHSAHFGV